MSEAYQQFKAECEARVKANEHYQRYLSVARNAAMREAIETIAVSFYIEGRLDERGGDEYDKAIEEHEATVSRHD